MNSRICFITHIGGADAEFCRNEYNYVLGSLAHHAEMGRHIVLDTTPLQFRFIPGKLPDSVKWIYDPTYGFGESKFRYADALNRLISEATFIGAQVVCYVDADEFFTLGTEKVAFPLAFSHVILPSIVHWDYLPAPYHFRQEFHIRIWPLRFRGYFPREVKAWIQNPSYDGNPQRHTICQFYHDVPFQRIAVPIHHHLRGAVGTKRHGSVEAGERLDPAHFPWPEPLRLWRERGREPMEDFR